MDRIIHKLGITYRKEEDEKEGQDFWEGCVFAETNMEISMGGQRKQGMF